jgi:glycosyltransferase involved in cell wall biosynthesis
MKKVLIITPHLSTGGAPQVTLNKIKLIKDDYIIKCVEYNFVAWNYVVQRNQIENILGDNFHSLGDNKFDLLDIVREFNPDIISMEEFPEFFMDDNITKVLYKEDRSYTIFETTHDSSFPVTSKKWFPDKFIFVSAFNAFRYSIYDIPYDIVEYPVDQKYKDKGGSQQKLEFDPSYKHVLNVGLFTQRKNQGYIFEIAQRLKDHKIKFHFLGNQADNFKSYWEPLLNEKTDNCVIWGERSDVSTFIEACDLFLFPSRGDRNNKELNPIAIKEAIKYELPMMMFNLDVYCGKYNNNPKIIGTITQ